MKVCHVGSLINENSLDKIVVNSRVKPSNAPVNFQSMLYKGLIANNISVTAYSLPTVSTYPNGSLLLWKRKEEELTLGGSVEWIPCLNLMGFKQMTVEIEVFSTEKELQ